MNSAPFFSVIIVNYNGGSCLQRALDSLAAQTFSDFELLLVDNASADGSIDSVDLSGLERVRVLRQTENHGFAKGNNIAAHEAQGEWLILLNPDCIAKEDWLESIARGIERHPDISTFTCAQIDLNTPSQLDGIGDAYSIFGIPWRGGFGRPIEELPPEGYCFSACGASAVYRKRLFLDVGGFDERFFCYCEDVDLGYRLQLLGHDCLFLPDAVVHHEGSAISGRYSYFTTYHGNRNRTWLFIKNTPLLLLVLTFPGHILMLAYIYMRNRKRNDHDGLKKGLLDGLKGGWRLRRESDYKAGQRRISILTLSRRMSWNPVRLSARLSHIRPIKKT
ncbi:glycosyltransferase family 2 protein [Henriciella mobilis]|uniref:Glycosyltransferase family 2 protein n=1 Tax=Henriciella mobilis TaxID=2305467 RepID=A0A399RQR3_9PROT|nr:glycosyltransferase family 2 protein [Henriciella mobilis]RIJ32329.1 glycosyltransferase family 2 protein [Henriciella mobilis]